MSIIYSQIIENYVEMIYDLRKKQNFKDELTGAIEMLVDEIGNMVEEDLLLAMILRSVEMLNKNHVTYDE
jgi:hypothetical protein